MTQKLQVLQFIRETGSITTRQAAVELGIMSLHRRLTDLRRDGHKIDHETVDWGNKRFYRYYLRAEK